MTSLYRLDAAAANIAAWCGVDAGADPWNGGYVAPGKPAPVIVNGDKADSRRHLRPMFWGVPPPPRGENPATHVRNLDSPFWIGTLRHIELRCLIPATSFAYWSGPAGAKRQHWFSCPAYPLFAIAGIIRYADDLPHFAMLMTDPNPLIEPYHPGAMPLILHRDDQDRWLSAEWKAAQALVAPVPGHLMSVGDNPLPRAPM